VGSALSRALRLAIGALGLAAILALGLLPAPRHTEATSFNPHLQASLSNPATDSVSNLVIDFSIDAPDANFETIVTFLPADFFMARDEDVLDGALAGVLNATSTLGLLNGSCNSTVPVAFDLMDASTDVDRTFPLYSGYGDYDGNGLPENVDYYPDFLGRVAPGITPRERLYGQTLVAGVQTFVNFVLFEPGAAIPKIPALDPALGYPTMVFLNDPTQPSQPFAITDFCTPLDTTTTMFGESEDNPATTDDESGYELRRTPVAAGEYNSVSFVRSQWDADNDGIENALDPCPLSANPGWDPRANSGGDAEGDGLPDACDPTAFYNSDEDNDQYQNRQDNCPLIANGYPLDSDHDLIGDACDPAPDEPANGGAAHRHEVCVLDTFVVGSGGPAAQDVQCPNGPDLPTPLLLEGFPEQAVRPTGTVHSVEVWIWDPTTARRLPAVNVAIEVTGANPTAGGCLTSEYGGCAFNYLGANVGTDTITLTAQAQGQNLTATIQVEWMLPPANDDFADAYDIAAVPFSSTVELGVAGREASEPHFCAGGGRTVWYDVTSESDRFVKIEAGGDGSYAYLGLYGGEDVAGLQPVACGYAYYHLSPEIEGEGLFDAVDSYVFAHLPAGETLHLQVSGGSLGPEPGNDIELTFEDAVEGDADCDGLADVTDVLALLMQMAGDEWTPCYGSADWDCNGRPSGADVQGALARLTALGAPLNDCAWSDSGDD